MINLALKETEILIDLEDEKHPGLQVRAATLDDAETARLLAGRLRTKDLQEAAAAGSSVDTLNIELPLESMLELFQSKVIGFVGDDVQIGDEPFDPRNTTHVRSLPFAWKLKVVSKLVVYATTLPEDVEKNSWAQDRPSDEVTTPSED